MVSKGKPSPRSAVKPLSKAQFEALAAKHTLVDPTRNHPVQRQNASGELPNQSQTTSKDANFNEKNSLSTKSTVENESFDNIDEINEQNPRATHRLLETMSWVMRTRSIVRAWGLERVPKEGVFITAATHVTMYDVFVPMVGLFHMGRRPRYMAKAELGSWPILGRWFRLVGMQPVPRRSGKSNQIISESIRILTNGRPLTVWPEGTVTRDPKKWVMSLQPGLATIALESSRRLGKQVPLYLAATWGAASINHWWPWPRKRVVMHYDGPLDYSDLLRDMESWGKEPPKGAVQELTKRVQRQLNSMLAEIRGEQVPDKIWDYRTMSYVPVPDVSDESTVIDAPITPAKPDTSHGNDVSDTLATSNVSDVSNTPDISDASAVSDAPAEPSASNAYTGA